MIAKEEIRAVTEVLRSGMLSGFRAKPDYFKGGKAINEFEERFAEYIGSKHAVTFNSATSALHTALLSCDIRPSDRVLVPCYTFSASASCILMCGAEPVFCDIDPLSFNMHIDIPRIQSLDPLPKAAIIVHLQGHPAHKALIRAKGIFLGKWASRKNIKIIEDASQSIGASYLGKNTGTWGDCGVFSFNQFKHINCGEGGMLVTDNDDIAHKARLIRNHAENFTDMLGYNYRMTEVTAAIGIEQLKKLPDELYRRRCIALKLNHELDKIDGLTPPIVYPDCSHSWYTYAVKYNNPFMTREKFQAEMDKNGIYFGGKYVTPLHLLPLFQQYAPEGGCPVAERMWKTELIVTDFKKWSYNPDRVAGTVRKVLGVDNPL